MFQTRREVGHEGLTISSFFKIRLTSINKSTSHPSQRHLYPYPLIGETSSGMNAAISISSALILQIS